jgi:copper chaperone CopZ
MQSYTADMGMEVFMAADVSSDQLAVIRIEGMHCHRCEQSIQKALLRTPGVHEVEVDFNSGQASVLFDRVRVGVAQLLQAVSDAGYRTTGLLQGQAQESFEQSH